jgi:hypothetical protein
LNQSEGHLKLLERVNAMEKQHEQLLTRNNVLQRVNDQLLKEKLTMKNYLYQLNYKIMILEKEAEENVTRSLTNHEEVFQEFLSSSIGRTRLASMIYVISMNHGEGIGISEAPRKKKSLEDQKSASNVYTKE